MLAYCTAVLEAEVGADNVLDLGASKSVDKSGFNNGRSKLFVRACYKPLADLIMEARSKQKNVVMSGTPGIGKTEFRNYFVYYLAQQMKAGGPLYTIVLHGTPGRRAADCSVLTAKRDGDALSLSAVRVPSTTLNSTINRDDPNLVYLLDVSEGDSKEKLELPAGRTVMFTSPNKKAYQEFAKAHLFIGKPLTMPLWKLPEMESAARMLEMDPTTDHFKEMWRRYGGVPRAVLESEGPDDHGYDNKIQQALTEMKWHDCMASIGATDDTNGTKHRLVYYVVAEDDDGNYDFKDAKLYFGTDYLLTLAADKYLEEMADAVTTVMNSRWPGVAPGVKGDFLEAVAHRALCWSRSLRLRRVKHTSKHLFTGTSPGAVPVFEEQAPLEWAWFSDVAGAGTHIQKALENGTAVYLRPFDDQFPAIDAILVTTDGQVILLQMTISKHHGTTGRDAKAVLQQLVAACPGDEVALVFVVPPTRFADYPEQDVPTTGSKRVRQYAVVADGGHNKKHKAESAGKVDEEGGDE